MKENERKIGDVTEKISGNNVVDIQSVIDVDKYNKSMESGYDLCGTYAPFCAFCEKSTSYPCAEAYLKSLPAEKAEPKKPAAPRTRKSAAAKTKKPAAEKAEEAVAEQPKEAAAEKVEEAAAEKPKRKTRVAVARKKLN